MLQKRLLFLAAQEIRLIPEAFGKSIVSKRSSVLLAFGTRLFPGRSL
jgi:hypothetical protein